MYIDEKLIKILEPHRGETIDVNYAISLIKTIAKEYETEQCNIPVVVQAKPEEVFRWALFAQKLPDVSRNIDLMHIDGSIRPNFKITQKELDDLNKWTPRKWRYAT